MPYDVPFRLRSLDKHIAAERIYRERAQQLGWTDEYERHERTIDALADLRDLREVGLWPSTLLGGRVR